MIECPKCEGRGGFACTEPSSPGCDETGEIETCRDCNGTGIAQCYCGGDAEMIIDGDFVCMLCAVQVHYDSANNG